MTGLRRETFLPRLGLSYIARYSRAAFLMCSLGLLKSFSAKGIARLAIGLDPPAPVINDLGLALGYFLGLLRPLVTPVFLFPGTLIGRLIRKSP